MSTPTFVNYKFIERLFCCTHATAAKKLAQTRDALGKQKLITGRWQPVSVDEFCGYWGVDKKLLTCEKSTTSQAV